MLAFRYTKPHALALSVKRHTETPVLTTTVDDANAITVVTERGQIITKIRYQVRNQLKQYLAVKLPQDAELWSAFVGGEPVKPIKAEDGKYRIPLAKSQMENQGQAGFPVELIIYHLAPKLLPIGYRSLKLPMPDAPVSRMLWSVYLPEKYRFPYFGGDVEKSAAAEPWNAMHGQFIAGNLREEEKECLMKSFYSFARKFISAKGGGAGDYAVAQQTELASDLFQQNEPVPTASGVFPVAFELPASGQLFHFGQIMVVGEDPELTMVFLHVRILDGILLAAFACLGYFLLKVEWLQGIRGRIKTVSTNLLMPRCHMREAQNGHDEWKQAIEKAQELLEQGRKEMARAAEMAKEKGEEALAAARKKSREAWDDVRASGLNALDDVRDKGEEMWEDAEKAR